MGEENQKEEKDKDFLGFSINKNLVSKADKDAIVLHCLPAYRDKEITDEIIESNKSRIFEQAENRLHAQQALLACLFSSRYLHPVVLIGTFVLAYICFNERHL